jgi:hypothetical protein
VSQVATYPASTRSEKRIHRVKARRTLRLPRLSRIPFWVWASTYAGVGSVVVVTLSR